jgi:hypothetical protein
MSNPPKGLNAVTRWAVQDDLRALVLPDRDDLKECVEQVKASPDAADRILAYNAAIFSRFPERMKGQELLAVYHAVLDLVLDLPVDQWVAKHTPWSMPEAA